MIFGTATLLKFSPLNCTPHPPLKWMQKNRRTERKCLGLFSLSLATEKRLEGTVQFRFNGNSFLVSFLGYVLKLLLALLIIMLCLLWFWQQPGHITQANTGTASKAILGNFWETEWSLYGLFQAHRYHLELNWAELVSVHNVCCSLLLQRGFHKGKCLTGIPA